MQSQTLPDHRTITFDPMADVDPITAPVDEAGDALTGRIRRAFLAAEVIDVDDSFDVAIDLAAGTVAVSADGAVIERGTITGPGVGTDYWLTLADDIRQAADRVASLAGQPKPPYVGLAINVANPGNQDATAAGRVDVIAAAFGLTAETRQSSGRYYERSTRGQMGQLSVSIYGYVPDPDRSELETLRARVAELEAQQGGAR